MAVMALWILLCGPASVSAEEALKMAVFPRKSLEETAKAFDPLAKHLSRKIGRRVELVVFKDFSSFWDGLSRLRYDLVHYNQYHYIRSRKEFGYQVILINEESGMTHSRPVLIVRTDSGIETIADLSGRKIIFGGGRQAFMSYIAVLDLLNRGGLKNGEYVEEFAITPPNVILSVFGRLADAGGVGDAALKFSSIRGRMDPKEIRILARGEEIPMLPWAVNKGMDETLRELIVETMIGLKKDKEQSVILKDMEVTAFVPATDHQYDIVRRIVKEVLKEEY
jgi:phosphonate transport system substrate-binding protein